MQRWPRAPLSPSPRPCPTLAPPFSSPAARSHAVERREGRDTTEDCVAHPHKHRLHRCSSTRLGAGGCEFGEADGNGEVDDARVVRAREFDGCEGVGVVFEEGVAEEEAAHVHQRHVDEAVHALEGRGRRDT